MTPGLLILHLRPRVRISQKFCSRREGKSIRRRIASLKSTAHGPPREQVVSQKARRKGIWNLKTSETHKPTEAYQMGKSDNWKVKQFLIYRRPRYPCSSSGVKEFSYHLRCYRKDLTLFNNWPNIRVVKLFNSRDTFLFEETRETSMPCFRKCVSKLLR